MTTDPKPFELEQYILEQLDHMEARPQMWAGCIEALESRYLGLLEVLAAAKGFDREQPEGAHHQPIVLRIYHEETYTGAQGCIAIWARDDQDITFDDAAAYLRRVRGRVLP